MKKIQTAILLLLILSVTALNGCSSKAGQDTNAAEDTAQTAAQDSAAQDNASQSAALKDDQTPTQSASQSADAGQEAAEEQSASSGIVFEARDMDGNVVSSDIFADARLTMVNVWATYCNPCLSEMPGLGELAGEYDPEDFQLIGIVSDVLEGGDEAQIALAASLIEQTGADYSHLLLNRSLYEGLLTGVSAVPTTFFVDGNGTVLDTVIGALDKSSWEERINGFLEK